MQLMSELVQNSEQGLTKTYATHSQRGRAVLRHVGKVFLAAKKCEQPSFKLLQTSCNLM